MGTYHNDSLQTSHEVKFIINKDSHQSFIYCDQTKPNLVNMEVQ